MSTTEEEELERCQKLIGSTIRGKWRLDALLGVGGMAAVYAATHRMGRRDAIKILHPHVAFSKELRARFEQEAHAISRLGHPGTAQVLDIDETDDGAPFMVMELLDGESLGQRALRTDGIPERDLLGYAEKVLDVLVAAHDQGIVHRDIKPDNLFITSDGRVKVLDFGIARMREGGTSIQTRTGAMLGTTSYMAPEQIHGRSIDGRADLFALGATIFRILAKRPIHESSTDTEMLIKMGSAPAPALLSVAPRVSPRIAAIVDRALAFDRDHRYPDARSMLADVRAVLWGDPVAAVAPPIASTAATWSSGAAKLESSTHGKKPPLALIVGVGVATLAVGIGVTAFVMTRDSGTKKSSSSEEDAPRKKRPASTSARPASSVKPAPPSSAKPSAEPREPELLDRRIREILRKEQR